jgi:hypothetical protein
VDSLRYAVQAENGNAHFEINLVLVQGITPTHSYPLISLTPTPLGEEKGILAKRAVVLSCRLLSLVNCCAGRAGQRVARLSANYSTPRLAGS